MTTRQKLAYLESKRNGWGITMYECGCIHQYANNGLGEMSERGFYICRKHKKQYPYYKSNLSEVIMEVHGVLGPGER